jgi:hypothetical protein
MSFQDIRIVRQFNIINGYVQTDRYGRGPLAGVLALPGVGLKELTVHNQKWVETVSENGGVVECCAEPPATEISRNVVTTVVETTPSTPDWPPTPDYPDGDYTPTPCICPYDTQTYITTWLTAVFYDSNGNTPYIMQEVCGCRNSFATREVFLYPDTGRQNNCYWSGTIQNGDFTIVITYDTGLCLWIVTIYCNDQTIIWQGSSPTRDGNYTVYGGPWCAPFGWVTITPYYPEYTPQN